MDLLVKTLLYAIVDFFERRNFDKCIKYLERIKFIKNCSKSYVNINQQNKCLSIIFNSYKNKIKRKYKMIHDYPFTMSYKLNNIENNGIVKCIYRKMRIYNHEKLHELFNKYNIDCKDKKSYDKNNSEITQEDTDKK